MKKKQPLFIVIPVLIAVLLVVLYFFNKEDVEVTDISINRKVNPCKVDFILINKLNYYISCRVSIRGFRRTPGRHTAGVVEPGFSGEKIIDIELYPKERKVIRETLILSGATSRIQVNAFNVRILQ
jgi:hypothetical protein